MRLKNSVSPQGIPILKDKYNFHNHYEKLKNVLRDPSDENVMLSLSQQIGKMMRSRTSIFDTYYENQDLQEEFITITNEN